MSVTAVVVTYNRADLLARCLDAIAEQTRPPERVLVVDNASTDATAAVIPRHDVEHVRLERNRGSSGGFAEAVSRARVGGSDWLWFVDDDSAPAPDALERLLCAPPAADPGTVALCPKVVRGDGSLDANQRGSFRGRLRPLPASAYRPGDYLEIDFLSFVGALVRTSAARATDPPRADFFVWGDDIEWSLRLRSRGAIRLVSESLMVHRRVSQSHSNARSRLLARLTGVELYPTPIERFWQNLCGLRNHIWIKRTYEGQSALSACGTVALFLAKHLLIDDRPLLRGRWLVRYARDGRAGRFHNIEPAEWARMVTDRSPASSARG